MQGYQIAQVEYNPIFSALLHVVAPAHGQPQLVCVDGHIQPTHPPANRIVRTLAHNHLAMLQLPTGPKSRPRRGVAHGNMRVTALTRLP
jgi:hypothetical protein